MTSVGVDMTAVMELKELDDFIYDIYISGPMTGLPNFNYDAFNEVAQKIRILGLSVFNPAEVFSGRTDLDKKHYMRADIAAVVKSKMLVLLEGWETSSGAQLEVEVAKACGIECVGVKRFYKMVGRILKDLETNKIQPMQFKHLQEKAMRK